MHVTGFEPAQAPDWHESVCVHALPSLQVVPFVAAGFEHAPVPGLQLPATWHWSSAVHVTGFDPVHAPDWHESVCVHASPSLQLVPFVAAGFEHAPVPALQLPATWHWSSAVHVTGFLPVHAPDWHESVCVHASPSLQLVPFVAAGFEHAPVPGLQLPATWHWSSAVHVTGFDRRARPRLARVRLRARVAVVAARPVRRGGVRARARPRVAAPRHMALSSAVHVTGFDPVHAPDWHESVCVHASPSLQLVPFVAAGFEHAPVPGLYVPAT